MKEMRDYYNKTKWVFTTHFPFLVTVVCPEEERDKIAAKFFAKHTNKNGPNVYAMAMSCADQFHWETRIWKLEDTVERDIFGGTLKEVAQFATRLKILHEAQDAGIKIDPTLEMTETEVRILTTIIVNS